MKLINLIPVVEHDMEEDKWNKIWVFSMSKNERTIFLTSFILFDPPEEYFDKKTFVGNVFHEAFFENGEVRNRDLINNISLGYKKVHNIISGNANLNPSKYYFIDYLNYNISRALLIQDEETFGTDKLFKPLTINFFSLDFLGSGDKKPNSLFGFNVFQYFADYSESIQMAKVFKADNIFMNTYFDKSKIPPFPISHRYRVFFCMPYPVDSFTNEDFTIAYFPRKRTKIINKIPESLITEKTSLSIPDFFNKYVSGDMINLSMKEIEQDIEKDYREIEITSTMNDKPIGNIAIVVNCDGGYVNYQKLSTDENGIARVKFFPLGIDKGQTVRVNTGFKFFTNQTYLDIVV